MRVMVIDATTTFGVALVDTLLADPGVSVVVAVGRELESARRAQRLRHVAVDLRRPRALHDLVWGLARELGVTCVAYDIQDVDITRRLMIACTGHPTIRRVVYRSFAEVYSTARAPTTLVDEDAALDFARASPMHDRVASDLVACAYNTSALSVAVLRCAEILAPGTGSQLWDYLQSRVCLRPAGFDPMINVLSLEDAVHAMTAALARSATGPFNIPGATTLPLSIAIEQSGRADIPVPGMLIGPLYRLRRRIAGFEFRYDLNLQRFHFGGILDGTRAREELGFVPTTPARWPRSWWARLLSRLGDQGLLDAAALRNSAGHD
jgi:nucleoside-diphosphate-sugar epimerase